MQEPESSDPPGKQPQEPPEILKLRDELARLKQKRAETKDRDILAVLEMRIKEIEPTLPPLPVSGAEEAESEEVVQLRAELIRLKGKLAQTTDRDIIAVLQMRINQVEPLLPANRGAVASTTQTESAAPTVEKEEEVVPIIPLPSPEQADKAEQLIRQSMLEKRRGNKVGATDLLKKAVEAAPGSPTVLEALGDDYLERRMMKEAREVYKRAVKLDPKNVGLERKWAEIVFQGVPNMSFEDQMRAGDSLFMSGNDNVAGIGAARFFSAIFPGVGQMVVGRTLKGAVILVFWVLGFLFIALEQDNFTILRKYIRGAGPPPNWIILVPIIGMVVVWLIAMADLTGKKSKKVTRTAKVDRPTPPVDLPFD